MSTTLTDISLLEIIECPDCHIRHAIPADMARRARQTGTGAYCPSGHFYSWNGNSELDNAKRALDAAKRDAEWQRSQRQAAEVKAEKVRLQLRATKGVVTRVQRRVKHGVCPCCNRTFRQLAEHMAEKHPDYGTEPR